MEIFCRPISHLQLQFFTETSLYMKSNTSSNIVGASARHSRFSPENKASIKPFTYVPFGFGPRICFGMRFALLEGKMALVRVMQQYRFDVSSETEVSVHSSSLTLRFLAL